MQPNPDELTMYLHVVNPPMRFERPTQSGVIHTGDEKVLVSVRYPKQLIAYSTPDDICVKV
jgi:hypothetical protein